MSGRTEQQMVTIATRRMKDLHLEISTKWGVPAVVIANSTFDLGVKLLRESGYLDEEIVEMVRQLGAPK